MPPHAGCCYYQELHVFYLLVQQYKCNQIYIILVPESG